VIRVSIAEMSTAQENKLEQPISPNIGQLVTDWASVNGRKFSWREASRSPYEILVAEMLLKRTTAQAASAVYNRFLELYPDVQSLAHAPLDQLAETLRSVGLYQQRAQGFRAMSFYIIEEHNGRIPVELGHLLAVPQIGPYSARALMTFAHNIPTAIVDSNVVRVLGRVYLERLGDRPTLKEVQLLADQVLPVDRRKEFNWGLLDLGALVCRYDRPRCEECPLISICDLADTLSESNQQLEHRQGGK